MCGRPSGAALLIGEVYGYIAVGGVLIYKSASVPLSGYISSLQDLQKHAAKA